MCFMVQMKRYFAEKKFSFTSRNVNFFACPDAGSVTSKESPNVHKSCPKMISLEK